MNIIQAMEDRELFAGHFAKRRLLGSGDSWKSWKAFLAGLFGLPLTGGLRDIYERHTGRKDVAEVQEAWAICGRRSGKTEIGAVTGVFLATFRDYRPYLAPGETAVLPIICPDRRQAVVMLSYVKALLKGSRLLEEMVSRELAESVELKNGVTIAVMTASYRATRGFTMVSCILDEAAFLRDESGANPDKEIIAAALPAMATIPGALLLGISSPYAKRGALYERFQNYYGVTGSPVLVWRGSTHEMNPTISRTFIAAQYLKDPAAASAEYGASFRDDVESFVGSAVIEPLVIRGRRELPFDDKHTYVGFVDPSGGSSDSMTLAIAHVEKGVGILDCVREVKPPFSPESVCREFSSTLRRYRLHEVIGDRYSGAWVKEGFAKHLIEYRLAEKSRSDLYLELLPALMSQQVELLDHAGLISQLSSLERRTTRFGRDAVDHQSGGHDDIANVVAGALVLAIGESTASYGVLDAMKAKFEQFGDDVEKWLTPRPREPKPSPVAARQSPAKPKAAERPTCPACGNAAVVRLAVVTQSWGYRCNQCGATFTQDGSVLSKPDNVSGPCCGNPLPVKIGNSQHCNSCGKDTPLGQVAYGISRKDYEASRGSGRFSH